MSIRNAVVTVLLRIYPAAWRDEYGAELTEILVTGPLNPRVICDVIWNGFWQRVRFAPPFTILGVASLLVIMGGFVLPAGRYGPAGTALLQLTSMTFPTVEVTFLSTEVYAFLLIGCGFWTHRRFGGTATQAGVAAMKMSLIASIPIILGGLLMATGILDVMFFFGPGSPASALSEHGFANPSLPRPHVLAILVAPFARLPEYWMFGAIGGQLGRRIARARPAATAS